MLKCVCVYIYTRWGTLDLSFYSNNNDNDNNDDTATTNNNICIEATNGHLLSVLACCNSCVHICNKDETVKSDRFACGSGLDIFVLFCFVDLIFVMKQKDLRISWANT